MIFIKPNLRNDFESCLMVSWILLDLLIRFLLGAENHLHFPGSLAGFPDLGKIATSCKLSSILDVLGSDSLEFYRQ